MTVELNKKANPLPYLFVHTHTAFKNWIELQRLRFAVAYERKQLKQLTPQQLRDIGIDKDTAHKESCRNFTDIPQRKSP